MVYWSVEGRGGLGSSLVWGPFALFLLLFLFRLGLGCSGVTSTMLFPIFLWTIPAPLE